MCKAKANGNYINSILALREALDAGCEEALLLDNEGYVAEGSGENVLSYEMAKSTPELTSCLEELRVTAFSELRLTLVMKSRSAELLAMNFMWPTKLSLRVPRLR